VISLLQSKDDLSSNFAGRFGIDHVDIKLFVTVAGTVFLAELGDKTQLATVLFAAKSPTNLLTVFIAASLALIAASALGVAAGGIISQYVSPKYLSYAAGVGFILIGIWTISYA
jgi:putative Ca2+/H+ antiporter (TMEM165/GDT1 family)